MTDLTKYLDELEELSLNPTITEKDNDYIYNYIWHHYDKWLKHDILEHLKGMRDALECKDSYEMKEYRLMIDFKHLSLYINEGCATMSFRTYQKYKPEILLGIYHNSDDEERHDMRHYFNEDGTVRVAPDYVEPFDRDPKWTDVSDDTKYRARCELERILRRLATDVRGMEFMIRDKRTSRINQELRRQRGVKQIKKYCNGFISFIEIPIDDPIPEGCVETNY